MSDTTNQQDLVNTCRTRHPKRAECTLYKRPQSTSQDRPHPVHETHLSKFKRSEIMQFSDHNGIKLEINNKNTRTSLDTWKLNNTLSNNT